MLSPPNRGLYHAPQIPAGIQSFQRIPVESGGKKMAEGPANIAIPGSVYSSGIQAFRN